MRRNLISRRDPVITNRRLIERDSTVPRESTQIETKVQRGKQEVSENQTTPSEEAMIDIQ